MRQGDAPEPIVARQGLSNRENGYGAEHDEPPRPARKLARVHRMDPCVNPTLSKAQAVLAQRPTQFVNGNGS